MHSFYLLMRKPSPLFCENTESGQIKWYHPLDSFLACSTFSFLQTRALHSFWIELREKSIHLSWWGAWLTDQSFWACHILRPLFLGYFPWSSRCLSPSTGMLQLGSVHLPYQATAPNLAAVFPWIHSTHNSPCWNPHHYSRHCKGVRSEKTPWQLIPSTLELGKIHGKDSCIL